MGRDLDSFHPFLDELGCNFSFRFTNITVSEQELAIEIRNIDGVCRDKSARSKSRAQALPTHIYDMNILEPRESKIL